MKERQNNKKQSKITEKMNAHYPPTPSMAATDYNMESSATEDDFPFWDRNGPGGRGLSLHGGGGGGGGITQGGDGSYQMPIGLHNVGRVRGISAYSDRSNTYTQQNGNNQNKHYNRSYSPTPGIQQKLAYFIFPMFFFFFYKCPCCVCFMFALYLLCIFWVFFFVCFICFL